MLQVKRALLSVSDKSGIVELASALHALGVELISTDGTSRLLQEASIPHRLVSDLTAAQEALDGRVKTIHPRIHGAILADRVRHADEITELQLPLIDMVVTNFYPFTKTIAEESDVAKVIEAIDIGGPAMVRAAAKNHGFVAVIVDTNDYATVSQILQQEGGLSKNLCAALALKAFQHTAYYDSLIADYFAARECKEVLSMLAPVETKTLPLRSSISLRYGENPEQTAHAFTLATGTSGLLHATCHQGKTLSYNNLLDADAALETVREFSEPAAVIVKHGSPTGVATNRTIEDAFTKALAADPVSAFGGIVALNRLCSENLMSQILSSFYEVIVAPSYDAKALELALQKPALRVLAIANDTPPTDQYRSIQGGLLMQSAMQEKDDGEFQVVTKRQPTDEEWQAMRFAWRVVKHVKSNAIAVTDENSTLGLAGGHVSRIDAVAHALKKADGRGSLQVLASDAFFPFRDSIDAIAATKVTAIIQPGGSVRDQAVIDACNEHDLTMVFTGYRCFKH